MGLILDSSVVVAAERRGDTVEQLIERIIVATGDQEAALSAIAITELARISHMTIMCEGLGKSIGNFEEGVGPGANSETRLRALGGESTSKIKRRGIFDWLACDFRQGSAMAWRRVAS